MSESIEGEVFDAKLAGKIICLVAEDADVGVRRVRKFFDDRRFHLIVRRYRYEVENVLPQLSDSSPVVVVTNLDLQAAGDGILVIQKVRMILLDALVVIWTKHFDLMIQRALEAGADFAVRKYTDDEASMAEAIIAVLQQRKEET